MTSAAKGEEPLKPTVKDIAAGLPAVVGKEAPDTIDQLEATSLEEDRRREEIENLKSDRKLREKYADKIIRFLQAYAIGVGFLVILSGAPWIPFTLPDQVLITLVGSTAAAAIGLVGFVARGLFGNRPK